MRCARPRRPARAARRAAARTAARGKPAPTARTADSAWQVIASPAATAPNASSNELIARAGRAAARRRGTPASDQNARAFGSRALHPDPRLADDVLGPDVLARGQRMVVAQDRVALLGEDRDHREPVVEERRAHERDVDRRPPRSPAAGWFEPGVRDLRARRPGWRSAKTPHRLARERHDRRARQPDAQRRPLGAQRRVELADARVERRQRRDARAAGALARLGQARPCASCARTACTPRRRLELLDLRRQRLLRDEQPLGRAREVQLLRDGDERAQQPRVEIHHRDGRIYNAGRSITRSSSCPAGRRAVSPGSHMASRGRALQTEGRPRGGLRRDGASRARTGDLVTASHALSQLSYSPELGTRQRSLPRRWLLAAGPSVDIRGEH